MMSPSDWRDRAVQSMFDRIAARYDLLNRIISFRLDTRWRRRAIRTLLAIEHPSIVDLGTGTGDLAFNASKIAGAKAYVVGLDFSMQMIRLAQLKRRHAPYRANIVFVQASALQGPFKGAVFDGAMTAFVLRNVSDLERFFFEAHRLLKPGGRFVSLDMFAPSSGWFASLYGFYFYRLMPWIGGLLAQDRKAYQYLSESVRRFDPPESVARMIERAGFIDVKVEKFLRGAVCMHVATKAPVSLESS